MNLEGEVAQGVLGFGILGGEGKYLSPTGRQHGVAQSPARSSGLRSGAWETFAHSDAKDPRCSTLMFLLLNHQYPQIIVTKARSVNFGSCDPTERALANG